MKIYLLFTGGTIGSKAMENGLISPNVQTSNQLLDMYFGSKEFNKHNCQSQLDLIAETPYQILSENLSAHHLNKLIRYIKMGLCRNDLDGMIIMHGTDTLQYTAATLGYVFENAPIPIVIASSNYVLDDQRANGLTNFHYALEFIRGKYGKGVFVSYCNQGDAPTIHCATRLQASLPFSDDVYSVFGAWHGRFMPASNNLNDMSERIYIANKKAQFKRSDNVSFAEILQLRLDSQTDAIMRIAPYPGMSYPVLTKQTKVILHESYHSGTIGVSEQFKVWAAQALELGIPIYLTGYLAQESEYETIEQYRSLGVMPLPNCSVISQYCKLWLALSNGMDLSEIMGNCMAGDQV